MSLVLCIVVSFAASLTGAICGIGGGVIIKPVLDLFQVADVTTIHFLSSCTVLAMSLYSVVKNLLGGEKRVSMKTGTFLAAGAILGGFLGKWLFQRAALLFSESSRLTSAQSLLLAVLMMLSLCYMLSSNRIRKHEIKNSAACVCIGTGLGTISSFLGIGGGPFNLLVFDYFFKMNIKEAAVNSLYVIMCSQLSGLFINIATKAVPDFSKPTLIAMVICGIGGGFFGRRINKALPEKHVQKLFHILIIVIIGIAVSNFIRGLR